VIRSALFSLAILLAAPLFAAAQVGIDPLAPSVQSPNALTTPSYSANVAFLFDLERRFAADTAAGGGAAFARWFAEDAVTLSNGQAPVLGRAAIAAGATWAPDTYRLTWNPEGARLSPLGDMGFTWGHYTGHGKDRNGNSVDNSGRYMTVWKKQADGSWKVELDASNNEPAEKNDCCKLP
jgi:ketosteroid isomerase-like protein